MHPEHNEGVLTMTEPQVWTLIAVFTAVMLGTFTAVSTLFVHVVRAEVGGLRGEIRSLDRDVQALMKHSFGIDRD